MEGSKVLLVRDLTVVYKTLEGTLYAVDSVSFDIEKGESLCLVGESGSGKSTIALAIMRALPTNAYIYDKSKIILNGVDLLRLSKEEFSKIRGKEISIIFQDPAASFNPLFTIGETIMDVLRHNLGIKDKNKLREMALKALKEAGLPDVERVFNSYPHELSGGMLQRASIAIAISVQPSLLIADEPTTMLDVTLQAQILDTLKELKDKMNLSILFITHNLGVAAYICDKILVIYAGRALEYGPTFDVLKNPLHPYTIKLIKSVPRISIKQGKLPFIPGSLPDLRNPPKGCIFAPRCDEAMDICFKKKPEFVEARPGHLVRCHKYNRV